MCQVQDINVLSYFLNAESIDWTDVCDLVNISYARSGQTCKCSVSTHIVQIGITSLRFPRMSSSLIVLTAQPARLPYTVLLGNGAMFEKVVVIGLCPVHCGILLLSSLRASSTVF